MLACERSRIRTYRSSSFGRTMATALSQCHSSSDLDHGPQSKQRPATQIAELRPESQMSEEDRQKVRSYRRPEFTAPEFNVCYTSDMHPRVATATEDTYQWLLHHRVDSLFSPEIYKKIRNLNCPELVGMVYIDAEPQRIDWASKFMVWLFTLDDLMDDTVMGMSPESSLPVFVEMNLVLLWSFPEDPVLHEKFMHFITSLPNSDLRKATLEGVEIELSKAKNSPTKVYDGKLSPLSSCFRDIWATVVETGPKLLSLRIGHSVQGYFMGNLEESTNREGKAIPSVAKYILNRRRTGAVEPCIMILDFVCNIHSSIDLFDKLPMQRLIDAVIDIVCWHNDIWSFRKEVSKGEHQNLVFLISHEQKCSYTEAGLIVRDMVDSRIVDLKHAFVDLQAVVEPADQPAVSAYIKTCLRWLSGTERFHRDRSTQRFM